jgi:hypothetical protein
MLMQTLHCGESLEISFAGRVIGTIKATQTGKTILACDFPREYQIRRAGTRLKLAANVMPTMAGDEIPDCGNGE